MTTESNSAIKTAITILSEGRDMPPDVTNAAFTTIMSGEASTVQITAFLMGLRVKGETSAELSAAAHSMRSHMRKIKAPEDAIDIVGTGGDGASTFNISTACAFVVAGCGVPVAKHGNKAVTSKSGASDVLTALGVRVDCSPSVTQDALDEVGLCFMMAPVYHTAMRNVMPVRLELGVRTLFNILGPICNPAQVKRAMIGVFAPELTERFAQALADLNMKHAIIVHGAGGLDELSTLGSSRVTELHEGQISTQQWHPEDYGFAPVSLDALRGGNGEENAKIMRCLFKGDKGPLRDIVLYNAGAALTISGKVKKVAEGIRMAKDSIDSGAAEARLNALIEITNQSH